METINGYFNLYEKYQGISVALGTFDGVHLGHCKIIERVVKTAQLRGGTSVVFTFEPHPRTVLRPERILPLLTNYQEKRDILSSLGVDVLFMLPFHIGFAQLSPEEFVRDILVKLIRPELVVVGPNYRFGHEGRGTPELLQKLGLVYGFCVEVVEPVYLDGQMVSSTAIRKLINQGEVAKASNLLGRPFSIQGSVASGDRRGRTLGYPTANMQLPSSTVLPADGVYAVRVHIGQSTYNGVANMGANPTFQTRQRRLEVHVLDFAGDLYGQELRVQFIEHLRDEMSFNDASELALQIAEDIKKARNILKT